MKEILQLHFLGNTVELYIEVFGAIVFAYIVKHIISKYFASVLFRLFTIEVKRFHKNAFLEFIVGPLDAFIFFLVVIIALDKLALPSILDFAIYGVATKSILRAVANAILIIVFIRLCLGLMKFLAFILEEK